MALIDRYILRQIFGPFVFFVVVFGGVIWLNQALRIVDVVVSNGQSGLVFAELSIYLLPKVLETVLPVAGFAAAVLLTNRLYSESELVVLMGAGRAPVMVVFPFALFGLGLDGGLSEEIKHRLERNRQNSGDQSFDQDVGLIRSVYR